ncbi:MAG: shikimate kinase [Deltaproteobacteria bacterium]|nr:shikimate kinase [Deltaproteobacteria bacterium]
MNLVLIGYRAAGKTTVGRRLSAFLRRTFVDSDETIEKQQEMTIKDIVRYHGWDYFRTVERDVISEISKDDHLIISAGGGVVIDPENVKALKRNGFIVWLKADVEVLLERMAREIQSIIKRPSLTGKGSLNEFREVLIQREPLYAAASEVQVDTSQLDVEGVVHHILRIFNERRVRI